MSMPLCQSRTTGGGLRLARSLALTLIFALVTSLVLSAQKPVSLTVSVVDKSGAEVVHADITTWVTPAQ